MMTRPRTAKHFTPPKIRKPELRCVSNGTGKLQSVSFTGLTNSNRITLRPINGMPLIVRLKASSNNFQAPQRAESPAKRGGCQRRSSLENHHQPSNSKYSVQSLGVRSQCAIMGRQNSY